MERLTNILLNAVRKLNVISKQCFKYSVNLCGTVLANAIILYR